MADPLITALRRLPHGPEFCFLDELTSIDPGHSGTGEYTVRAGELFLRGHFPSEPIFPGVLLLEAATQLAGAVVQSDAQIPSLPDLKLTAIRGVKILGSAKPGDVIRFEAHIVKRLGKLVQVQVSACVKDQLILEGEITLSGSS